MSEIIFVDNMNLSFKNPTDSIRNILAMINVFRKSEKIVPMCDKQ